MLVKGDVIHGRALTIVRADRALSVTVPVVAPSQLACSHIRAKPRLQQLLHFGAVIFFLKNGDASIPRGLRCIHRLSGGCN
jgi:hypothetical protein